MPNRTLSFEIDDDAPWLHLLVCRYPGEDTGTRIEECDGGPWNLDTDAGRRSYGLALSRLIRHAWEMARDADAKHRTCRADVSVVEQIRGTWRAEADTDDHGVAVEPCPCCGNEHGVPYASPCEICGWEWDD